VKIIRLDIVIQVLTLTCQLLCVGFNDLLSFRLLKNVSLKESIGKFFIL